MAMANDRFKVGESDFSYRLGKVGQRANYTWYRGEGCRFNPAGRNLETAKDVAEFVLDGWLPPRPFIGPKTRVSAFGSCFAEHISSWLERRNFVVVTRKNGDYAKAYVVRCGEGMVNSFVIRQQLEWTFEDRHFEEELWHGYDAQAFGYDESVRVMTRAAFDETDVFIITLGLSEVWYDDVSGGVFWRAIPKNKFDARRHRFRVSTVDENRSNIRRIYDLIAKFRPEAKIIFTLSPIPLVATFRPVSCITANSVSKAILRASLDEVLRDVAAEGRAFYWPSYEIVMELFDNQWRPDRRHVRPEILDFVMTLFEAHWCEGKAQFSTEEAWIRARLACSRLPRRLSRFLADLRCWWLRACQPGALAGAPPAGQGR